ncbi:MAG TPA: C39 family peptidase [bacterium]|nr:C39 family peptidase [bacterium]
MTKIQPSKKSATINPAMIIFSLFVLSARLFAQPYPDQHFVWQDEDLVADIEINDGVRVSDDGKSLMLADGKVSGLVTLKSQTTPYPFDQGLPSWNGTASGVVNGFVVQMRFGIGDGWSPWLTAGYWKDHIWSSYGLTRYEGGEIDYDYVLLNSPQTRFQFRIYITRNTAAAVSPAVSKLSFFASDSRTTAAVDIDALVADKPEAIFIPTTFYHQYSLDPEIGSSICSPTSVSMILRSYDIAVEPVQFARDTYDPYWKIFGMWPRVVQNAHEYGLDGAVTRYRSWSQARAVLAAGGRIAMSVGLPLYSGHLIMLAGFTEDGRPIVHDPAKSNGYAYIFNKASLSRSWFEKGGIAYTFYPLETSPAIIAQQPTGQASGFRLHQNYPNPFNAATTLTYTLSQDAHMVLAVYDITGQLMTTLLDEWKSAGEHTIVWNADSLPSGNYFVRLISPREQKTIKCVLIK